ncbi:MAG: peptide chain release factor N(5)-glutamine methyltransferase [Patescibacteria group bacterium]
MPDKSPHLTVRVVLGHAAKCLQPKRIVCDEDRNLGLLEAELFLSHLLKKDRTWLRIHDSSRLSSTVSRLFSQMVARRMKHEPVAYILGTKEFYGLPFRVDKRVLIPRPESELIVERVLEILKRKPTTGDLAWDIGTGSGAIALAIAKEIAPRHVLASDISMGAITVAKQNARSLKIKNVSFIKANLLDASARRQLEKINPLRLVVTANLPYLPLSDKKKLDKDVVAFEPTNALFAKQNGLELIEKLLRQLASFDIHFDTLLLEYDPPQTKTLRALARSIFPKAKLTIHKDLAGRDRILKLTR